MIHYAIVYYTKDCKALLDDMVTDKTCNIEYHIPSGGYLYVI